MNGSRVSLVGLKKVRAFVTAVSDDDVSHATTFDDVQLDKDGRGVTLDYLVPAKTRQLDVRVTADFYSAAREAVVSLESRRTVAVSAMQGQSVFYSFCVRPDSASPRGEDYLVQMLGRNGEPYRKQRVSVALSPVYGANDTRASCETDADGCIRVKAAGRLLTAFEVQSQDAPGPQPITRRCAVADHSEVAMVPSRYDVVEGEELVLPRGHSDGVRADAARRYDLVRVSEADPSVVVSDAGALITERDGALCVAGLAKGAYAFRYREAGGGGRLVRITVLRGERWEASPAAYLATATGIRRLANYGVSLSLRDVALDEAAGRLRLRVASQDMDSVEVHVLAFSYFPRTLSELRQQLARLHDPDVGSEEFRFRSTGSSFLSEKRLSDEARYVLDRKRRRPYMGSTLEKPPGLLQREFVRETTDEEERLEAGADYAQEVAADEVADEVVADECDMGPPMTAMERQMMSKKRAAPASGMFRGYGAGRPPVRGDYNVERMTGFLSSAGWSALCVAPDAATGRVEVEVPLDAGYSTLVIVARDSRGSVVTTRALPVRASPPRVDVRLAESKSASNVYVQERVARCLAAGETYEASDADAAEMRLVDRTATVLKVFRTLSDRSCLDEWDFLGQWATLTPVEQLRKYDRYMCHELNLFAYFKDREFFDAVVRPHLACKTRKGVVDWFLLGDAAALAAVMGDVARTAALSPLERTLLVAGLAGSHPAECAAIAAEARDTAGSESDRDARLYERLFDSVLSGREPVEEVMATAGAAYGSMGGAPGGNSGAMHSAGAVNPMMLNRSRAAPMMAMACAPCPPAALMMDAMEVEEAVMREEVCDDGDASDFKDSSPRDVAEVRKYHFVGTTSEFREREYYGGEEPSLSASSHFWAAAVAHFVQPAAAAGAARPFLTENFMYATGSLGEMLLATALLGVGVATPAHRAERAGQALRVAAGAPAVVFAREMRERDAGRLDLDVLVTQRMCDPDDQYTVTNGTRTLKAVGEFLVGRLYLSRISVTNATESDVKLSLVTEVPQGAVPVVGLEYTRSQQLTLAPLSTQAHQFFFYFPVPGEFTCFPASVNKDGLMVAAAKPLGALRAVRTRTATKMETISDILNQGSKDDILAFMGRENLRDSGVFTFGAIYWLLGDRDFYTAVIALLRRRRIYDHTVWSFAAHHGDVPTLREYLCREWAASPPDLKVVSDNDAAALCLRCGLAEVDTFRYLEYSPLVNSRAHDVGKSRQNIRNREFRQTYTSFLEYLAQKEPGVTRRDYVYWCTYLLLQDRVEEALQMHAAYVTADGEGDDNSNSDGDGCGLRVQRDYLAAYLSLYTDAASGFATARAIAARYLTYPVFTWRNRFVEVMNQIAEMDAPALRKAGGVETVTDADRNAAQAQAAPYLSCELDGAGVKVRVLNVPEFTVRLYHIDLETLFSQSPFLDVVNLDYSYVTANHTVKVPVAVAEGGAAGAAAGDDAATTHAAASRQPREQLVPIPAELAALNLFVQVSHGPISRSVTYFPNKMTVVALENYGQVRVLDAGTGAPMPLVYVKAFAKRASGDVGFFKDGYTDLRGTFEYASVQGGADKMAGVAEFSLLVLSDACGAALLRAAPPSRTAELVFGAAQARNDTVRQIHDRMVSGSNNKYCV